MSHTQNLKNLSTENVCLHSLVIYDLRVRVGHFVRLNRCTAAWLASSGAAAGQAAALLPEFSLPILYRFVSSLIIVPQRVVMATGIFADLRADRSASGSCFYVHLVTPWALAELISKTFVFLSPQLLHLFNLRHLKRVVVPVFPGSGSGSDESFHQFDLNSFK